MNKTYKRLDDLEYIVEELYARAGNNLIHENLMCFSWEQLCQEAKDILQWLKING